MAKIIKTATKDTFIDSSQPTVNFGNEGYLEIQGLGSNRRSILIDFDLSDITGREITSAKLQLYRGSSPWNTINSKVKYITSTWDETVVTHDTKPTFDNTIYDFHVDSGTLWETWDITGLVQNISNGLVPWFYGLCIFTDTNDGSYDDFIGLQHATIKLKPIIEIEYEGSPIPSIIAYHYDQFTTSYEVDKLTHIIYSFATIANTTYNITLNSTLLSNLVSTIRSESATCKVILGIGGYGAENFSDVCNSSSLRTQFAGQCLSLINTYDLDGIDLDWEYPNNARSGTEYRSTDGADFLLLLQEIKTTIGVSKELSIACADYYQYTEDLDIQAISLVVDKLNVMCYSFSDGSTHHSNLFNSKLFYNENSTNDIIQRFIGKGVSPEKIILGLGIYGKENGQSDYLYRDLVSNYIDKNGWVKYFDYTAMNPYLVNVAQGRKIFYEDAESIQYKCDYAKTNSLGGIMYWRYEIDTNDFELLTKIYEQMNITEVVSTFLDYIEGELHNNLKETVYIGSFNDDVDNIVSIHIYDLAGSETCFSDTYIRRSGLQLRIADTSYHSGYNRCRLILAKFKKYSVLNTAIFIKSDIIPLGLDAHNKSIFTINFNLTIIEE